jgi:hypothetical protein
MGTLLCNGQCQFDLTGCKSSAPVCGDGVAEGAKEGCDGADLLNASCEGLGLSGGTLKCTAACLFDTSGCTVVAPVCGDGAADESEACDGLDLKGANCQGLGLAPGTVTCTTECDFDTSGCNAHVPVCGDGLGEAAESCDGQDLRGNACEDIGFEAGTLACNDACGFDTSGCGTTGGDCDEPGAGGAGSECCEPLAEICDAQSNDCDAAIDEGDACPTGCTAKTFEGHLYLLCLHNSVLLQRDYAGASSFCTGAGTSLGLGVELELAHIESAAENDFVKEWIRAIATRAGMVWLGANDIAREGQWVWGQGEEATQFFAANTWGSGRSGGGSGEGGEPVNGQFNDFAEGQPNSANNTDEDCAALDSDFEWQWNDLLCTQSRLGHVCEQVDPDDGSGGGSGSFGGRGGW